jgi:MoaA/NifB/PqqE/SkfB family radical SAM enzyme
LCKWPYEIIYGDEKNGRTMFDSIKQFFNERPPMLEWMQIEVTSRCNAACVYCPRTVYRNSWLNRDFPPDLFESLLTSMRKVRIVHLQGWGEPFLNPEIFSMIRTARQAGCEVYTTTNGTLLTDKIIEEIINSGLSLISFSLAGFGSNNARIRPGTDSEEVINSVKRLNMKKMELGKKYPKIHLSYILLNSTIQDISLIHEKLSGTGIEDVIISTLDFIPDENLQNEAIRPGSGSNYSYILNELNRAVELCSKAGLKLYYRLPSPDILNPLCTENVLKSAYIGSGGDVFPCAYMALSVSEVLYMSDGRMVPYNGFSTGSLVETSFPKIWHGNDSRQFRNSFFTGGYFPMCRACPKRMED